MIEGDSVLVVIRLPREWRLDPDLEGDGHDRFRSWIKNARDGAYVNGVLVDYHKVEASQFTPPAIRRRYPCPEARFVEYERVFGWFEACHLPAPTHAGSLVVARNETS